MTRQSSCKSFKKSPISWFCSRRVWVFVFVFIRVNANTLFCVEHFCLCYIRSFLFCYFIFRHRSLRMATLRFVFRLKKFNQPNWSRITFSGELGLKVRRAKCVIEGAGLWLCLYLNGGIKVLPEHYYCKFQNKEYCIQQRNVTYSNVPFKWEKIIAPLYRWYILLRTCLGRLSSTFSSSTPSWSSSTVKFLEQEFVWHTT
jgi:hypothetical protein